MFCGGGNIRTMRLWGIMCNDELFDISGGAFMVGHFWRVFLAGFLGYLDSSCIFGRVFLG